MEVTRTSPCLRVGRLIGRAGRQPRGPRTAWAPPPTPGPDQHTTRTTHHQIDTMRGEDIETRPTPEETPGHQVYMHHSRYKLLMNVEYVSSQRGVHIFLMVVYLWSCGHVILEDLAGVVVIAHHTHTEQPRTRAKDEDPHTQSHRHRRKYTSVGPPLSFKYRDNAPGFTG